MAGTLFLNTNYKKKKKEKKMKVWMIKLTGGRGGVLYG